MSRLLTAMKGQQSITKTTNGAVVFSSTGDAIVDYFGKAGALRDNTPEVLRLFGLAYKDNPLMALRLAFYFRDIRGGQGERNAFRETMKWMAANDLDVLTNNIKNIFEFGRWDDVISLLELNNQKIDAIVLSIVSTQLQQDMVNLAGKKPVSLLAKWMPSENASSPKTIALAKKLRYLLGKQPKNYRKMLTSLRAAINIVETPMMEKNYNKVNYSQVPSRASMKYRKAFGRNDKARYGTYLESLSKGEVKVNTKALFPHEIVGKYIDTYGTMSKEEDILFDAMWKQYPDFLAGTTENAIAVVDVSGSMKGVPMQVAITMGLYHAERAKGPFKDHFITFSKSPVLEKVKGNTLEEKIRNMARAPWDMTTNFEKVFDLILGAAVAHKLPQEEMVQKLYVISDMQFNNAGGTTNELFYHAIQRKYQAHGYVMPTIVFWNVAANNAGVFPAQNGEPVQYVSGFSPSIFKFLVTGVNEPVKTPRELADEVANSERYSVISLSKAA